MNTKNSQRVFTNGNFFTQLASSLLVFLFLFSPIVPIFAQEVEMPISPEQSVELATPPGEVQDDIIEPPDNDQISPAVEEPNPEEELPVDEEKPIEKKPKEKELEMAAMMSQIGNAGLFATIASPEGNGISPEIDNLTGALVYNFKINVPPGRNKMTPDVALRYNSAAAARESIVGAGWEVNIPYIQRINKKGSDKLYTEDYFISSVDGELVSLGSGNYAAKVENGSFLKYSLASNVWTVTDKEGTVYKFGNTAGARQDNSADTSKVFKWMLEETRDTNNNYIKYTYYKDAGQIYPSQIIYTGNGSTDGVLEVNFDRTSRSNAPKLFNTGFSVQNNYRITEIRTEVNNTWARKYTLAYTTGDNSADSLLDTITESGQDDSSNVTTLPAANFDYNTSTKGWTYDSAASSAFPLNFLQSQTDTGTRVADVNGDGLTDVIQSLEGYGSSSNYIYVYLNNGAGGWTDVSSTWLFPLIGGAGSVREWFVQGQSSNNTTVHLSGLQVMEINGDNLPDLVRAGSSGKYVYFNNGSGWTYDSTASSAFPLTFLQNQTDTGTRAADINGDGLTDIIQSLEGYGSSSNYLYVYLNTGTGWTDVSSTWLFPLIGGAGSVREWFVQGNSSGNNTVEFSGLQLMDMNGDNLTDLVRSRNGNKYVYINNGSGWTYDSTMSSVFPLSFLTNQVDQGTRVGDINDDGLSDVIQSLEGYGSSNNYLYTYLNTATAWTDVSNTWLFPLIGGAGSVREWFVQGNSSNNNTITLSGLQLLDINGDNLPDLVRAGSGDKYVYFSNEDTQANVLTQITYPQGGSTAITYEATPQLMSGGSLLNPSLPLSMHVVSQIVNNDGLGNAETYTYSYAGGKYYFTTVLDKKFAGFASVTKTDASGNVQKTYYHQGDSTNTSLGEYSDHVSKIGKPYRLEEYDNSGNMYRLSVDKIDKYNIGTDHDFVKTVRHTVLNYDGDSDHADTASEYTYDNTYGNATQLINWGKVTGSTDGSFTDTGSDKLTEDISYTANTTDYIVGLPYQDTLTDQSAAKVRESKTYYDTQSLGTVTDGNPTKVEDWVTSSTYINNQKTYDGTYGLVATATDPRGKVTTYTTYDTYNLYPITITNPLSQTVQYTYDYSLGKPKQTTDQNGFVYQTIYDGLDRVTAEKIPDFTNPYSAVNKTVYAYTDTSGAVKVQRTDNLDGSVARETYQYFDGLGRLIQERKEAETDYNVKDITYSNRGLILKESIQYTSSGSSKTSATGTSSLYTNYTYDPLRRPATVVSPLGTTSYAYDDWKTTVTDAESNVKNYYKDARDNLIQVDEVNGGSTYTTNYEWNLNNKLTKITDALSNIRNFTYDGLGRRLTAEDLHASADGTYGIWTYAYDNAGNLTQTVSPNSLTTNYTYNDINQQLTENYTGAGGTEITYTYSGCTNGTGKLCSVTMTSGANTAYTYDSNGNLASEAKTINSTAYTTSYTYDRQGNKLIITYPDSAEVKYTFNAAGLLNKIERKESGGSFTDVVSNFDYSPMDQITTQADVNGVTTTNTYDAAKMYRLTRRLTQNTVPTKHQDLNYTYDNVNNITQIVDASAGSGSKTVAYVYDDLNRMTSATATGVAGGQSTYTHTYAYDALGNITSGPIGSYAYAGTNYANPHAETTINGVTYTYDNDGNLTGNGTLANTWNYKDQLTQAVVGAVTSTYLYDHAGERASLANGTTTTVYPNDFYNTDGTKKTKSIYAGDRLVATIETVSGVVTPFYPHTDQINSTTAVSDSTGALVETLDYFPFGNQRISTGSHTEQRQHIGEMYDIDTGLEYLNARMFKADIGRFISQDAVFLNPESMGPEIFNGWLKNPQAQNSYSYANNNPISLSDPDGKIALIDDAIGFVGGGLVGAGAYALTSAFAGENISWAGASGAFVTGGIIGWGAVNTPATLGASNVISAGIITGTIGGFYGDLTKQAIDVGTGKQSSINLNEANNSAAITGITSGVLQKVLPNARIAGLSSGRGNMNAIGQAMQTKLTNGTIKSVSVSTAAKSFIGSQASDAYRTAGGAVIDVLRSIKNKFNTKLKSN